MVESDPETRGDEAKGEMALLKQLRKKIMLSRGSGNQCSKHLNGEFKDKLK
jgi:hypothetical protein